MDETSFPQIQDYGIIGDCRAAALISREGSIEWLCWPRFDKPAIFCALLDREKGGSWRISPAEPAKILRRGTEEGAGASYPLQAPVLDSSGPAEARHLASWWFGTLLGLAHALFVLTVGVNLMAAVHPRMAREQHGPTATRQLEPPGFMALNYGLRTPISVFVAHAVFGAILGALYRLTS